MPNKRIYKLNSGNIKKESQNWTLSMGENFTICLNYQETDGSREIQDFFNNSNL
jgi:hypothetical protein